MFNLITGPKSRIRFCQLPAVNAFVCHLAPTPTHCLLPARTSLYLFAQNIYICRNYAANLAAQKLFYKFLGSIEDSCRIFMRIWAGLGCASLGSWASQVFAQFMSLYTNVSARMS